MGLGKGQKIVIDILIINGNKRVSHHVALACGLRQDVAKIVVCERSRSRRRMSDASGRSKMCDLTAKGVKFSKSAHELNIYKITNS